MLKKLIHLLERRHLTAWQIRETTTVSYQSFLAKEERECRREVRTRTYSVTIHLKRSSPGGEPVLGIAHFKIGPTDESVLKERLDEARFQATLVSNQLFDLPTQPAPVPAVGLMDPAAEAGCLDEFEDRVRRAVAREKNVRLSSAEFFIDRVTTRLCNHRGLDLSQDESVFQTELILLAGANGAEKEFINRTKRRFATDFNLEGEIGLSSQRAREAARAGLPKTGRFAVLLSDEPLDNLFNPLIAKTSARLKYNKMIQSEPGQPIVERKVQGDAISLRSNSLESRMMGSYRFDSFGTPGNQTALIENNLIKTFLADKRYADYLDIPVTGEFGNYDVSPGSVSFDDLPSVYGSKTDTLYHLTAFSAFEPNPITGAFSAEIRAGFELSPEGKRPIKGGSVSGVLQSALEDCRLSKERVKRERYLGPKGIVFKSLELAGN